MSPLTSLSRVAAFVFLSSLALAADKKQDTTFLPVILQVNSDSIVVKTGREAGLKQVVDGKELPPSNIKTFTVNDFTTYVVNGLKATLGDVQRGMVVQITQGTGQNTAAGVVANTYIPAKRKTGPKKQAGKKAKGNQKLFSDIRLPTVVDVSSEVITTGVPDSKAVAYRITASTTYKLDGQPADLSAVELDMKIRVSASGQNQAGMVEVFSIEEEEEEMPAWKKKK